MKKTMWRVSSRINMSKTSNSGSRQKTARDLEDAKAKERIEAFAITEIGECPVEVGTQGLVERPLICNDAVAPDHLPQQLGVTRLFEALKGYRLVHQRVGDLLRVGIDN